MELRIELQCFWSLTLTPQRNLRDHVQPTIQSPPTCHHSCPTTRPAICPARISNHMPPNRLPVIRAAPPPTRPRTPHCPSAHSQTHRRTRPARLSAPPAVRFLRFWGPEISEFRPEVTGKLAEVTGKIAGSYRKNYRKLQEKWPEVIGKIAGSYRKNGRKLQEKWPEVAGKMAGSYKKNCRKLQLISLIFGPKISEITTQVQGFWWLVAGAA